MENKPKTPYPKYRDKMSDSNYQRKFKKHITLDFKPSLKQYEALRLLMNKETNFVGYGGSAFSGKSWLLCNWLLANCLMYSGTSWGLGRRELTTLKKTTLLTLFKVMTEAGMEEAKDYTYNQQLNTISFKNESKIFLIDTAYKPSDPLYQRFGGYELTGCAIDESAETDEQAIQILFTRCGRRNNLKYQLSAKMLETFNPARNHVYRRYYRPFVDGTMKPTYSFVRALPSDNPSPEVQDYVQGIIDNSDKQTIERLVYGNFEYADDDSALIGQDAIRTCVTSRAITRSEMDRVPKQDRYITVDPARKGKDQTQIFVWYGTTIVKIKTIPVSRLNEVVDAVNELRREHMIEMRTVCVDTDGVGGGVGDYLPGCLEFVNNARPYKGENYEHAKAQCYYRLAKEINDGNVKVAEGAMTGPAIDLLVEELSYVRAKALLSDGRKGIISKDIVKKMIGRSPDYSDAMMMRMAFFYTRSTSDDVYFA